MKTIWKWIKEKSRWMKHKVWDPVKGMKRNIGVTLWLGALGMDAFFPELIGDSKKDFIILIGKILAGVGVLDALSHSKAAKKVTDKMKNIKIKPSKK